MFLQPTREFQEGGQIDGGLQAAGHLAAPIRVDHPRGNRLADFGTAEIKILHVSAAEFTHDTEVMLTKEWMKRIPNCHRALVTGIMVCRLQRARMGAQPEVMQPT